MATLEFNIKIEGLEEDTFVVRSFEGHECLSGEEYNQQPCYGFRYEIDLASRHYHLTPDQIIDKHAELLIHRSGELVQRAHGIVRSFSKGDTGHHHTFYSLTLVPALERLSLRHNSRIFQHQTVPEIISVLLQEMNIQDYNFVLSREYQQREFCVQYRENDLAFVQRLAAEEGLVYSLEHDEGKHTLVFSDNSKMLPKLAIPVPYNALSGGIADTPYIYEMQNRTQSEVAEVELRDRSFKAPQYNFAQSALESDLNYQRKDYHHYDYPGRYKDDINGKAFSQIRLEYLRRESHTGFGKSNQPLLRAGYRFQIEDHPDTDMNRSWLLVSVTHKGTQPQALEESGFDGATTYENTFKVIPDNKAWRAIPQPKPQVDGPMIAIVVGPENEEIYCDKHGRVKVHFPWDRYSKGDHNSSCWVRVSQGWAGAEYGTMALPRIGHEVIVDFIHGDPDQPIITGRTYHATNTPPYSLPEHKTKTVLRSETHQGEGFNELSFEDQSGSEKVYLHAQKDLEADILNDQITSIKHDNHLIVENDSFTHIKNNHHLTIEGESRAKVTKDQTVIIDGSAHIKANKALVTEAGSEIHIKAGEKMVIEAGSEITLKAGGSFVKIDPAGVHIIGPAVNLNSGGSAANGCGFSGQIAGLPLGMEPIEGPKQALYPPTQPSMTSLLPALAELDIPVSEVCQKRMGGTCSKPNCECTNNE